MTNAIRSIRNLFLLMEIVCGGCVAPQFHDGRPLPLGEHNRKTLSRPTPPSVPKKKKQDENRISEKIKPPVSKEEFEPESVAPSATEQDDPVTNATVEEMSLADIHAEIESSRRINLELHKQLKEDLKNTDPKTWPLMVKNIHMALAHQESNDDQQFTLDENDEANGRSINASKTSSLDIRRNRLRDDSPPVRTNLRNPQRTNTTSVKPAEGKAGTLPQGSVDEGNLAASDAAQPEHSQVELESNDDQGDKAETPETHVSFASDSDFTTPDRGRWKKQLFETIKLLETELQQKSDEATFDPQSYEPLQASLRLLYLIGGQANDAETAIPKLDVNRSEFWAHLMAALNEYFDNNGTPIMDRRAELALREMRVAVDSLSSASQLHIRNPAFCRKVESYGRYTEMKPYEFAPGDEVLLYVEIDNFETKKLDIDYMTEIEGSYQIIGRDGKRVSDHTFPKEREICRNRRRDYFVPFRIWMPKNIDPGEYTLQLTVEDKIGGKFGQASIEFAIQP